MKTSTQRPSPDRSARRSRLKDFYGLEESANANANLSQAEPFDAGSNDFQADAYMGQLLRERGLKSLLKAQCDLIAEIKTLDGDMKTLVYENYEKFISASDTIKKMKTNVESMETEMTRLGDQIALISEKSLAISSSFTQKRNQIRELGGQHNLLKKLQFIFELPQKLTTCLKRMQYLEAVRYYFRTSSLFTHYKDLVVFDKLAKECQTTMSEVLQRIKAKMNSEEANMQDITSGIGCLLAMGTPPLELSKQLIQLATRRLLVAKQQALDYDPCRVVQVAKQDASSSMDLVQRVANLKSVANQSIDVDLNFMSVGNDGAVSPTKSVSNVKLASVPLSPSKDAMHAKEASSSKDVMNAKESSTSKDKSSAEALAQGQAQPAVQQDQQRNIPAEDLAVAKVLYFNQHYLSELVILLDAYHAMFLTEPKNTKRAAIKENKVVLGADKLSFLDHKVAKRDIDECVRALIHDYFTTFEGFLSVPKASTEPVKSDNLITILDLLYSDVNTAAEKSATVKAILQPRAENLTGVFLNRIIHELFTLERDQFLAKVMNLDEELVKQSPVENAGPLVVFMDKISVWLYESLLPHTLAELKKFIVAQPRFMETYLIAFQEAVRFELKNFWTGLLAAMKKQIQSTTFRLSGGNQSGNARSVLILVMSRLCSQFAASSVRQSFVLFSREPDIWPQELKPSSSEPSSLALRSPNVVRPAFPEVEELIQQCRDAGQSFLLKFVDIVSAEFVLMVRKSLDTRNWVAMKEPRRVSKLWEQIIGDLDVLDKDIQQLFSFEPEAAIENTNSKELRQSDTNSISRASQSAAMSHVPSFGGHSAVSRHSSLLSGAATLSQATTNMMGRIGGALQDKFMNNLDKLFSERVEIYAKSIQPESRANILKALLRIILKAFIELIRLKTFAKCGYQQIQVDVEHLREHVWRFLSEEKWVNGMLDEVITSARGRCTEPIAMEYSVVERILAENKAVGAGSSNE